MIDQFSVQLAAPKSQLMHILIYRKAKNRLSSSSTRRPPLGLMGLYGHAGFKRVMLICSSIACNFSSQQGQGGRLGDKANMNFDSLEDANMWLSLPVTGIILICGFYSGISPTVL